MSQFPVQTISLSSSADAYKGFAANKFEVLERRRLDNNLPILSQFIPLDGSAWIKLISCDIGSKIIISAGGGYLFLTGDSGSGVFDWESGAVATNKIVAGTGIERERLFAAGLDTIYTNAAQTVKSLTSISMSDNPTAGMEPVYYPKHQIELFTDNINFYTLFENELITLGDIPLAYKSIFDSLPIRTAGDFVYLATQYNQPWNLYNPIEYNIFNPTNGVCVPSFYWTPSYFYATPGNAMFMKPGWYYGKFADWFIDTPNNNTGWAIPLSEATVVFCGLMESKDPSAQQKYGYCEALVKQDQYDVFYLNFFLSYSAFRELGNPYFFNLGAYEGTNTTAGTAPSGFARTAFLDLSDRFPNASWSETPNEATPKIHMWSCSSEVVESWNTVDIDAFMVVIAVGSKAVCYKYKGYFKLIWEGNDYHSHSSSHDGNIVSIFHADEGASTIARISTYNTFKRGSTEVYSENMDVSSHQFLTGEIIPNPEAKKTELPFSWDEISATVNLDQEFSYQIFYPPAMIVKYPDIHGGNASSVSMSGMECENGTHVHIKNYVDPCFESEIEVFRASSPSQECSFTVMGFSWSGPFNQAGYNLPGVLYQTVDDGTGSMPNEIAFQKFNKDKGSKSYSGAPDGSRMTTTPIDVSSTLNSFINTLSKNLIIARTVPFNTMEVVSPTLGDITYGGCFDSEGVEIPDCGTDEVTLSCGEYGSDGYFKRFTASTSCGQEGVAEEELTKEEYEAAKMVLYQDLDGNGDPISISAVNTGESAVVSGGVAPISWEVTGEASIEVENKGRLVTFYGGYCEGGSAVGTDVCGMTVYVNILSPDGSYGWYYIGNVNLIESWPEGCSCGSSFGYRAAYDQSGGAHSDTYPETRGVETHWGQYPIYDDGCSPDIKSGETIAGSAEEVINCWISLTCKSTDYCLEFPHDNDCYGLVCS